MARTIFPSRVELVTEATSSCIQTSDNSLYVVGNEASPTAVQGQLEQARWTTLYC